MTTKDRVQAVLDRLPDDCSLDDVLYHLYVVHRIDRGLADVLHRGRLVRTFDDGHLMRDA